MPLEPVANLQRLIQTPSVNPMGRDATGPTYGESRMTELLVGICREQGWPFLRQPVDEERDNLILVVEGHPSPAAGGELLLWDVHQDTVSAEGMTVEPFAGEVRDGRVFGRGACDVKGSMAAMLAALSRLAETSTGNSQKASEGARRPTIIMACTANEECGFTGAKALAGMIGGQTMEAAAKEAVEAREFVDRYLPRPPDAAIVAEPTQFDVVVAHQGQVRWRCHTVGRAAHSSRPDVGINAIYGMARVVQAIERYHAELSASTPHPLCDRPSVCVSTIHGGVAINTVPERVTIEIDRRIGPDETPAAAYEQLMRFIKENAEPGQCTVVHDSPLMQSMGLSESNNRDLANQVAAIVRQRDRGGKIVGVRYGTDAAAISATGVPTIVFGPGSIEQAHTADEFIEIEQLELATEIFHRIAQNGLR